MNATNATKLVILPANAPKKGADSEEAVEVEVEAAVDSVAAVEAVEAAVAVVVAAAEVLAAATTAEIRVTWPAIAQIPTRAEAAEGSGREAAVETMAVLRAIIADKVDILLASAAVEAEVVVAAAEAAVEDLAGIDRATIVENLAI